VHETPRKLAFCAHAIASTKDCLVVSDATKDPRFQDNPRVTGLPGIRFYAGAPLISPEGYKLGTFCVIDTKPRSFSLEDEKSLIDLSKMAVQTLVEHRRKMSGWFNDLVETHFPEFEVPDAVNNELSAASLGCEDDEDREFVNFLETTKHMSLESLLSSLQSQARAQDLAPESFQPYVALPEHDKTLAKPLVKRSTSAKPLGKRSTSAKPLGKRFRFQECGENGQVRAQVNTVESWKHMEELWWSPEEMRAIKMEAVSLAQHFRQQRPDYVKYIETVAKGKESQTVVEDTMRLLMKDSHARGLESFIVFLLKDNRRAVVEAVLKEQDKCDGSFERLSQCLRERSMAFSHISTRFAEKMGQCDQIDALKARTSRWRKAQQRPTQFRTECAIQ
jgi:hypothetical protein